MMTFLVSGKQLAMSPAKMLRHIFPMYRAFSASVFCSAYYAYPSRQNLLCIAANLRGPGLSCGALAERWRRLINNFRTRSRNCCHLNRWYPSASSIASSPHPMAEPRVQDWAHCHRSNHKTLSKLRDRIWSALSSGSPLLVVVRKSSIFAWNRLLSEASVWCWC